MRGIKRVTLVVVVSAVFLVILAFILENQQSVSLSFLGWNAPQASVSLYITLSLIVGMLISPFLMFLVSICGRRKLASRRVDC
ncbi:lipopolysaccharide assembly protein LapA domain-containing protein [Pseudomonas sp. S5D5]|uniref:lipopolysaccharide assembly protein LapA domain-containing protein n=1 Tax=Pseudomonas sp. S5D5 TaxID=2083056 RepID=UPI000D10AB95|nr:LapA family protein [Pseudomonas sp. S5D5]